MEPYLIVLAQIEEQRVEVFQIEVKPISYHLGSLIEVNEIPDKPGVIFNTPKVFPNTPKVSTVLTNEDGPNF
jgi:hypothetical protein